MAQSDRATHQTVYSSASGTFATNSTRDIGELDLRNYVQEASDSAVFKVDDYDYYIKGTTASGTDTYTIAETIPTAYTNGERFLITFTNANTGAATLNRNSLGAKDLLSQTGAALTSGQIAAGSTHLVRYNGTNYRILTLDISGMTNPMTTGGDIIYGGASGAPTRLANGSSGQLLRSNGGTSAPSWSDTEANIDTYFLVKEDFYTNWATNNFQFSSSQFNNGGGLGALPTSNLTFGVGNTEHALGVVDLGTSTSTAGGSRLSSPSMLQFTFGFGFTFDLEWRLALDNLSDGTDTYEIRFGFIDNDSAIVDGAYFRYTHSVNGGRWEAVTVSNSTETVEDTGISAAAGSFSLFRIVVNSDATQVDFYIDGTLVNDITTNIINDSARLTAIAATIEKTAGSTARHLYFDYVRLLTTRTTAR